MGRLTLAEHDCFRLARPLPDGSVPVGTTGVVLLVFPGPPRVYEVEFPDGNGRPLGAQLTYSVTEDFLVPL